ncbi:MAG: DUF3035 domain-containing protein [Rickettsiales bacterium]
MKRFIAPCLLALPLLLTACESGTMRDTLGLTRDAPDEFTVVSRPPLSLPPEFSLRPPRPGEAPRGTSANEQARSLLTGKAPGASSEPDKLEQPTVETAVTPVTSNEVLGTGAANLLKRAGADSADDLIRDKLTTDAVTPMDTSNAKTLMDQLTGDEKNEPVVDAKKEAERLRDNKDNGKPVTEGAVPEAETKPRSLIDRIF